MVALQCCVSLHCRKNESAIHIQISPPFHTSLPFRLPPCIRQSSLCFTVCSQQLSVLYIVSITYMCQSQSPNSSLPTPFPLGIHTFVLYVCVSISALQIRSSIPFFWIPHIWVTIRYLLFSFWLTSLCITLSRSIHVSTNDPISFFFMAE